MELSRRSQGGVRAIHTFDTQASLPLKTLLGATLPLYEADSIRAALARILDVLEQHVEAFAGSGNELTPEQRYVLERLRERLK
jgi:hypothetical protein